MEPYPNLSWTQQKYIFKSLFPAFKEYGTPFPYRAGIQNHLVVETWGQCDHLLVFLHPEEEYNRTPNRYTSETASLKLTVFEAIKHFYPRASDSDTYAIIQEILTSKRTPSKAFAKINPELLPHLPPMYTPDTKPEDVPDDLLGQFGKYKGYDPKWALCCLSERKKARSLKNGFT